MTVQAQEATFGGGCFWCLEAVFQELHGVQSVKSGYAGGAAPDPTYKQVCSGATGHAEVVQVRFDPRAIDYADLLRIFFAIHDPTTKDRQGNDRGTQYRSIILYADQAQRETAHAVLKEIEAEGIYPDPIVTEIEPLEKFWPAESDHDDYFRRNPDQPYCAVVVGPKVAKFRKRFRDRLRTPA
jgi:peptide-methionine (S)-S-oxide reductase